MTLRKSLFSNLNINSDYCDTNHVHVDRTLSTLNSQFSKVFHNWFWQIMLTYVNQGHTELGPRPSGLSMYPVTFPLQ
jgi:uncharacterized protein YfaT (DUF1175 family)